jgi:serine protease AprX
MAGIIAGDGTLSGGTYAGLAPRANLVSVKVASWDGSTDVSEVIAGLQWVVAHKSTYNIRVLNLSYGTDGTQTYRLDPLDYAVEQVWFSGIMVVVSAGNRGPDARTIDKPADDPFVLTVGAANVHDVTLGLPLLEADFSSRGPTQDGFAKPDLLAPGISIVSDRATGSTVDMLHPDARVGDYYFKGTGTSQATAVVSGIAALLFQANPALTPNLAKAILKSTAAPTASLSKTPLVQVGLALAAAKTYLGPPANQGLTRSSGLGTLEGSRGTFHVYAACGRSLVMITGSLTALCTQWTSTSWGADAWFSSPWVNYVVETAGWGTSAWAKKSWSGVSWDASSWDKKSWSDAGWSSTTWSVIGVPLSSWS